MHPRWRSGASIPSPYSQGGLQPVSLRPLGAESRGDLYGEYSAEPEESLWAAIAFVPTDAAWCDWIYRNLHGYTLPAELVDQKTPHGFSRPECFCIFPDRRDPAYEVHTADALKLGRYLIVVCSPTSAHNEAVDEQIRAFKQAGGEERIIVLVVDGPPDIELGERLRAPLCDWLPSWLSWRLEENGFRPADRSEPRIVESRRGYRSLQQVRDGLLAAVADIEPSEMERLGGFAKPMEAPSIRVPVSSPSSRSLTPVPLTLEVPDPTKSSSSFTIWTAIVLILLAAFFGTKSFLEFTAEDSPSPLEGKPGNGGYAGRFANRSGNESSANSGDAAHVAAADSEEPNAEHAPESPVVSTTAGTAAPHLQPVNAMTVSAIGGRNATTGSPQDVVLQDEVATLERRGDETLAEHRVDDALDLYTTALDSAQEYAGRKGSSPADKDQVVTLLRKLARLQADRSSLAEARTNLQQARKMLLQLRGQSTWNRDRALALDEVESRLLALPRE